MQGIIKLQSKTEKYFEEDCFITEILNTAEIPEVSVSQSKVKPRVTTVLHRLKETEESIISFPDREKWRLTEKLLV